MEIRINQQPLDFTLEGSETIAAVLLSLQQWVESGGEFIVESFIDGADMAAGIPDTLKHKPASEVNRIELTTCPPLGFRLRKLTILDNYLSVLEETVLKGTLTDIQAVADEYQYIQQQLAEELSGCSNANTSELHTIVQALRTEKRELTSSQQQSVAIIIQMARSILKDRIRELTHPQQESQLAAQNLQKMLPHIAEVSILLQSNAEKTAMQTVFSATELLSKLLRTLGILRISTDSDFPFSTIEAKETELRELLKELEAALTENDTVTIGDLLEYEITPIIEEVCATVLGRGVNG